MSTTWILACFWCLSLWLGPSTGTPSTTPERHTEAMNRQGSNGDRAFPVGGTATLSCTGVPYDGATKHWEKNPVLPVKYLVAIQTLLGQSSPGEPVYDATNIAAAGLTNRFTVTEDLMTATITGLRETDDGDYRCASGPSQIIHKLVTYKLRSVGIGHVATYVGGAFDVTCTADSKPAANFTWTKQGDSSFMATGATLRINDLKITGGGTYVCTAYHDYASDTASVQLTVEGGLSTSSITPGWQTEDASGLNTVSTTPGRQTEDPNVTPVSQTGGTGWDFKTVVVGCACSIGGLLVGGAAVFLFQRCRIRKNAARKQDVGNPADGLYENVAHRTVVPKQLGSGSDEYEVPMETIQPPTASTTVQSSDDYQELRPAVYQSLQRH